MKLRTRSDNSGMTLIESMIAVGISTFVFAGVISVFVMAQNVMHHTAQLNRVNSEARNFSEWLSRDLRSAIVVEDQLAFDGQIYSVTDGDLILRVPSIDEDEYVIRTNGSYDHVLYFLTEHECSEVIVREVIPNALSSREPGEKIFGDNVTGSSFRGVDTSILTGAGVIQYQFKDENAMRGTDHKMAVSGCVRLRNRSGIFAQ